MLLHRNNTNSLSDLYQNKHYEGQKTDGSNEWEREGKN